MNKQEKFIEKVLKRHGDSVDISKVHYVNSTTKVCLICHKKDKNGIEHGEYWQEPAACVRGNTCPKCANERRGKHNMTTEIFKQKEREVHGDKYNLDKVEYKSARYKVCIICPEHGEFWQMPFSHLQGQGCPKCSGRNYTLEDFVNEARKVHGDKYDYSKVIFGKMREKVTIKCPIHGDFKQTPQKHLLGQGCPICGRVKSTSTPQLNALKFEEQANKIHANKYIYDLLNYVDNTTKIRIICPIHGEFTQRPNNHLQGNGCPHCANNESKGESEIFGFLNKFIGCENKNRTILDGREIDIYIPSLKIGIEYDGLRWHSEEFGKGRSYHLKKLDDCSKKGVRLIHIFEDEWVEKKEVVKSRLMNLIGKTDRKIYARRCEIIDIDIPVATAFLKDNHIQGACSSQYRYGLYYDGELVALMTFGKLRKNLGSEATEGKYELLRYCSKRNTNVVGGASRLFKHFLKQTNPNEVTSYADRRWNSGKLYEMLGFTLSHKSQPSYFYVIGGKRHNRFNFRKDKLVKEGYDASKSEHQIMLDRKIYRIYDCGCLVFKYTKKNELGLIA